MKKNQEANGRSGSCNVVVAVVVLMICLVSGAVRAGGGEDEAFPFGWIYLGFGVFLRTWLDSELGHREQQR